MTVYLDCNATTPLEPRVRDEMMRYFDSEYGNAGSRTHEFGLRANRAVQRAREQVAAVVEAQSQEVVFTSGATESNNLAVLGLAPHGVDAGKRHIVSTQIEHKAVLEPLEALQQCGFEVTLVPPDTTGRVAASDVIEAVREDTLLVSIMHVNNETGVVQPLSGIGEALADHPAYFHVDAAQGFGKDLAPLCSGRIDLISVSAHKIYGPKGAGALIARSRGFKRPPLRPLMHGGGQERGLRPGTLPVPLIVGLGTAAEIAIKEHVCRAQKCFVFKEHLLHALEPLDPVFNGEPEITLPNVLNFCLPGLDSEAAMLALKGLVAVSNGSACTSASYEPSHVLKAMGLSDRRVQGAIRVSWCHLTSDVGWDHTVQALRRLL